MNTAQRYAALCLLALLTAGCGQKGPLYLEGYEPRSQRPPPVAKKQPPAQPETAPAENAEKEQH